MNKLMFQVHVVNARGKVIPVGPRVSEKGFAEQLLSDIKTHISAGRLHGWADPTVVTLLPQVTQ